MWQKYQVEGSRVSGACAAAVAALGYFLLDLIYTREKKTLLFKLLGVFCHSQLNLFLTDTLNLNDHL